MTPLHLGDRKGLDVNAWGSQHRGIQVLGPESAALRGGGYPDVVTWSKASSAEAVLTLDGIPNLCAAGDGQFKITRLKRDERGEISRVQLTFEQPCQDGSGGVIGRLCVNCPTSSTRLELAAQTKSTAGTPEPVTETAEFTAETDHPGPDRDPKEDFTWNVGEVPEVTIRPEILNDACPPGPESFLCAVAQEGAVVAANTAFLYLTPAEGIFTVDHAKSTVVVTHKGLVHYNSDSLQSGGNC